LQGLLGTYSIPESYRFWYALSDIYVAINEKICRNTVSVCSDQKKKMAIERF